MTDQEYIEQILAGIAGRTDDERRAEAVDEIDRLCRDFVKAARDARTPGLTDEAKDIIRRNLFRLRRHILERQEALAEDGIFVSISFSANGSPIRVNRQSSSIIGF